MSYAKPRIVAKSVPKQAFVSGCPLKWGLAYCTQLNVNCMAGPLK